MQRTFFILSVLIVLSELSARMCGTSSKNVKVKVYTKEKRSLSLYKDGFSFCGTMVEMHLGQVLQNFA